MLFKPDDASIQPFEVEVNIFSSGKCAGSATHSGQVLNFNEILTSAPTCRKGMENIMQGPVSLKTFVRR
ncbi:hypothetical protein ANCCAN_11582 [Ancylostoma caninum]|uniref:Uncharacterized protein n=1 Tax=Ancylostoma caninum TaxID=29170 RepID=A0A368GDE9_ANCCA|nr:hypothetical protein ANCCAN_11582 [Ancylostoma caninum]